jgi:hypothetical protein
LRAARTTADQEDPLEASEAVDFTSLLADALLGHGPAAVENDEATMIEANVREFKTCRPGDCPLIERKLPLLYWHHEH